MMRIDTNIFDDAVNKIGPKENHTLGMREAIMLSKTYSQFENQGSEGNE